jgi:polyisoprenoid-binding protein YceI
MNRETLKRMAAGACSGKKGLMLHPHADTTSTVTPGRYRVDPDRSTVRYAGRHMFGLGTVHATFSVREGDLRIGGAVETLSTRVVVEAASFRSGSARRDRDVRAAGLLDVERYPDITFTSDRVEVMGEGWIVAGSVTAHGQSVPAVVRVDRLTVDGSDIRAHGWVRDLDRTAFGITGSRGLVGRHLDLELDVVASSV